MPEIHSKISLPIMPLRFRFDAPGRLEMPGYPGSAWRGAFGHALKQTVCVNRGVECDACLLYRACAYPYLFQTPPPAGSAKMTRYPTVPVPYLLNIETHQRPNEYVLGFTLVGEAQRHLPYVAHAMKLAGERGVGSRRQSFLLSEIQQFNLQTRTWKGIYRPDQPLSAEPACCPNIPELPDTMEFRILTPLRLRRADHLVTPERFRFRDLFRALLRRVSMLTYFHGESALETDFAGLTRASERVEIDSIDLRWKDWTRYSSRQKTEMQMGGIIGRFQLRGQGLEPFWPYLWIGQWLHTAKGATMGLGRYRIEAERLRDNPEYHAAI